MRDLEYAVAVDRERHFGRAAEACGISQAGLSEQVRKLESILGLTLFERTKRKVTTTSRGREVLDLAQALLLDARRLLASAREHALPFTGELRLGVIPTLGPYYVPSVIARMRTAFPHLSLRLQERQTEELLASLRDGELDAALVALPIPLDGLQTEALFFEPFHAAFPHGHAIEDRRELALADLHDGPLLLMEDGHCLRDQTLALCDARQLSSRNRYASSLEMLRHMIAAGEGVSLIPALAGLRHGTASDMIGYRELRDPEVGRTIALAWRITEPREGELTQIAAHLRASLPECVRPL